MAGAADDIARYKEEAARQAVTYIEDGMIVGLGTGSTARFMIDALGDRIREEGLKIESIATSEASAHQAYELGIPRTDFLAHPELDIAIDGADEVLRGSLELIKGLGGALLREKIVASSAKRFVVIVDDSKLVAQLGTRAPLPVEVTAWGWERVAALLKRLGPTAVKPRFTSDGTLYMTDNHNVILDCHFDGIETPDALSHDILSITGVVDHGLFLGLTSEVLVAGATGVERMVRA